MAPGNKKTECADTIHKTINLFQDERRRPTEPSAGDSSKEPEHTRYISEQKEENKILSLNRTVAA